MAERFFVLGFLGVLVYFAVFLSTTLVYDTNRLPHRLIGEIDLQGHMYLAPAHVCQSVYDAPDGVLRFCWTGL